MATPYALVGASCLADGHPASCTEPAPGTIENVDSNTPITIDGTVVADHGDSMEFPSHAHAYEDIDDDGSNECTNIQSHSLTPDQEAPWTVDGRPLMREGDSTTDPGSGGTAEINNASQNDFEVVD